MSLQLQHEPRRRPRHQPRQAKGSSDDPPRLVIQPARGWPIVDPRELWRYRELIAVLAWRDIRVRYKQTLLGAAWAVLQPALMTVVFCAFLGRARGVGQGGRPYALEVFAGLLPWMLFTSGVANAGGSVIGSERLVTKIYFPRLVLPMAAVGSALVDFASASLVLATLMACHGIAPSGNWVFVPVVTALVALAALGVGALLAAFNVAYRDFKYVIPFLLQLWLFATPTVYLPSGGSAAGAGRGWLGLLFRLNPMITLIDFFRATVLGGPLPWAALAQAAAWTFVLLTAGCLYFRHVEDSFADII
jgi:lipopolysaccharide transport system permease protein